MYRQPTHSVTRAHPLPAGTRLQRKCACGAHSHGGGQCTECEKKDQALQRQLSIGASNDPLEREADRVAEHVTANTGHLGDRPAVHGIQRAASHTTSEAGAAAPASVDATLSQGGRPLEGALRQDMEHRFGHDFSGVRVHSDPLAARSAEEVSANAYTVGGHIVFGAGQFEPASARGSRLLAHELTHVVQQGSAGRLSLQRDEKKDKDKPKTDATQQQQPAPVTPDPATAYFHIVVRDATLNMGGGVLVSDLAAAKTRLMQRRVDKPWTLVLAIHASEIVWVHRRRRTGRRTRSSMTMQP